MKKITLNETDLLKIVKRVLNEQKNIQFDEDEIEFLYFIFERELKPPFSKSEINKYGVYLCYNRDGEKIGWLTSEKNFSIKYDTFWLNIKDKICQVFEFLPHEWDWYHEVKPHLKSWLESNLNVKLNKVDL